MPALNAASAKLDVHRGWRLRNGFSARTSCCRRMTTRSLGTCWSEAMPPMRMPPTKTPASAEIRRRAATATASPLWRHEGT
jgi:hypothetical protein